MTIPIAVALIVASAGTVSFAGVKTKVVPAKTTADKASDKSDKSSTKAPPPEPPIENVTGVTTAELVDKPHEFLNKNVKFTAKFYVFSNLPLDYKPALRSAKTHLGFLVLRPESHVPFSELKIAMPIPKEKDPLNQLLGSLKDGDEIEVIAKVFSTQLDEPWLDVLRLKRLSSAPDDKDKDKTASAEHDSNVDKAHNEGRFTPGRHPMPPNILNIAPNSKETAPDALPKIKGSPSNPESPNSNGSSGEPHEHEDKQKSD